jgi:hypothetical protein
MEFLKQLVHLLQHKVVSEWYSLSTVMENLQMEFENWRFILQINWPTIDFREEGDKILSVILPQEFNIITMKISQLIQRTTS